jgi:hypothetical protein
VSALASYGIESRTHDDGSSAAAQSTMHLHLHHESLVYALWGGSNWIILSQIKSQKLQITQRFPVFCRSNVRRSFAQLGYMHLSAQPRSHKAENTADRAAYRGLRTATSWTGGCWKPWARLLASSLSLSGPCCTPRPLSLGRSSCPPRKRWPGGRRYPPWPGGA